MEPQTADPAADGADVVVETPVEPNEPVSEEVEPETPIATE